jgi:hypothetical protein
MSLSSLRALVLEANVAFHGMPVTVTVPGGDPVETSVIWLTPETEAVPGAQDFRRKEASQVLVLRRADVPLVPRKTIVEGAPHAGVSRRWMVDGTDRVEVDRVYVVLVPAVED